MKSTIIIAVIIVVAYLAFTSGASNTILYNGIEYKLAREEGGSGFYKYHYTESGKDTGENDYVEILKFEKTEISEEGLSNTKTMIKKMYKGNHVSGTGGEFGIFGVNDQNYAYLLSSETSSTYWFAHYVIQSGSADLSEAKNNKEKMIIELEELLKSLKQMSTISGFV